jgi:DNA-binding NarL/FixJ family response regulator
MKMENLTDKAREAKNAYKREWMHENKGSDKARELKNEYQKAWRRKNPEKVRQYNIDFWERKAGGTSIIQKVKELSRKGLSQRMIAKELNISVGTVNRYLNSH